MRVMAEGYSTPAFVIGVGSTGFGADGEKRIVFRDSDGTWKTALVTLQAIAGPAVAQVETADRHQAFAGQVAETLLAWQPRLANSAEGDQVVEVAARVAFNLVQNDWRPGPAMKEAVQAALDYAEQRNDGRFDHSSPGVFALGRLLELMEDKLGGEQKPVAKVGYLFIQKSDQDRVYRLFDEETYRWITSGQCGRSQGWMNPIYWPDHTTPERVRRMIWLRMEGNKPMPAEFWPMFRSFQMESDRLHWATEMVLGGQVAAFNDPAGLAEFCRAHNVKIVESAKWAG